VLVHGWGAASATWVHQLQGLSDELDVHALDLPGFGRSPAPPRADAETFATAVKDYVDREGLADVVLVGWSMGGLVVMSYCDRFGAHALAGIGIVDVAPRARPAADWAVGADVGDGFGTSVDDWIGRWPSEREAVLREVTELAFANVERHEADVEWLVEEALKADPDAAIEAFVQLLECDFRDSLERVSVPALLLYGGCSTSTTPSVARFMEQRLPDSRLRMFDRCGHAIMLEDPAGFNTAVREFVGSLPAWSGG
jgi:non-heme chloroperoxidase